MIVEIKCELSENCEKLGEEKNARTCRFFE
jgi:hypothetical protein